MFRTRRLTPDDVLQPLGDLVLGVLGLALIVVIIAVGVLGIGMDWLQRKRLLAPISLGVLIALVLIHLIGCSTAPVRDPRDPEVWRPTAPARYPLPR